VYTHEYYLKVKTIILDFEWSKDAVGSKIIFKPFFYLKFLSYEVPIYVLFYAETHAIAHL